MLEPESLAWWKRLVFDYSDVTSVLCDEIKRLRAINTEMVAALVSLVEQFEEGEGRGLGLCWYLAGNGIVGSFEEDRFERARAAIAKARGEIKGA